MQININSVRIDSKTPRRERYGLLASNHQEDYMIQFIPLQNSIAITDPRFSFEAIPRNRMHEIWILISLIFTCSEGIHLRGKHRIDGRWFESLNSSDPLSLLNSWCMIAYISGTMELNAKPAIRFRVNGNQCRSCQWWFQAFREEADIVCLHRFHKRVYVQSSWMQRGILEILMIFY